MIDKIELRYIKKPFLKTIFALIVVLVLILLFTKILVYDSLNIFDGVKIFAGLGFCICLVSVFLNRLFRPVAWVIETDTLKNKNIFWRFLNRPNHQPKQIKLTGLTKISDKSISQPTPWLVGFFTEITMTEQYYICLDFDDGKQFLMVKANLDFSSGIFMKKLQSYLK